MSSDTVADKSGFLRMYMSNHPDTLVAYIKHFARVDGTISSPEMLDISSKNMTLRYEAQEGEKKQANIEFNPPLAGYEEVKSRLLGMKAEAQEALGMIKSPQITSYRFPPLAPLTGLFLALQTYCTFAPESGWPAIFEPARFLRSSVGGPTTLNYIWVFVFVVHSLEALYTLSLCRKHCTGFVTGAAYCISTFIFGFPSFTDLRRRVQEARIASVMKVE